MSVPAKDTAGGRAAGSSVGARLRRMPKRYLVLLAQVPVLVVLWLPLLSGKSGRRPPPAGGRPTSAIEPPPAAPGVESAPATTSTGVVASAAALQERLQALTAPFAPQWRPDGAQSPFRAPLVAMTATPEQEDASLTPTAIVLSAAEAPVAIIGGQTYRLGDTIAGRSIVAIEERRVLYRQGAKTYAVSLPEPNLRRGP